MEVIRDLQYTQSDFRGGVVKALPVIRLGPEELSDGQNVVASRVGPAGRREGIGKYLPSEVLEDEAVTALGKFYREGSDESILCGACKTGIYDLAAASDYYTIDEGAYVEFQRFRDRFYFTAWLDDSSQKMGVVAEHPDGTTGLAGFDWGLVAPLVKSGVTATGTGPTGDYKYKRVYVYGINGERGDSGGSPESDESSETNKTRQVELFPAGCGYADWDALKNGGVSAMKVFRAPEIDGVFDHFYYMATVTSGTTYDDDGTDSPDEEDEPNGREPMMAGKFCLAHEGYMLTAHLKDGTSYYPAGVALSYIDSPEEMLPAMFMEAPCQHGAVTGLAELNGSIYVFFESAVGRITIADSLTWKFEIVDEGSGCRAPRSIARGVDGNAAMLFYLGSDFQVYELDGHVARTISGEIDPLLEEGEWSLFEGCAGGWDGRSYRLSYPGEGASANSKELRYDTKCRKESQLLQRSVGTWWPQEYKLGTVAPGVYLRLTGREDINEFLWADAMGTGYIFEDGTEDGDDGVDIDGWMDSGCWALGGATFVKALETLIVDMETFDDVQVRWDVDFRRRSGSFWAPAQGVIPRWGEVYWGEFYWAGERPYRRVHNVTGGPEFRWVRVRVRSRDQNEPWRLLSLSVGYRVKRKEMGK